MATIIPQKILQAIIYIITLDELQRSPGKIAGTFKWQEWYWTQEESEFWTSLRDVVEPLLQPYMEKKTITSAQRENVKQAIKSAHEYASFDVQGHRLMLKIAAHGDVMDWTAANIKFGTSLAKKTNIAKSESLKMLEPSLNIIGNIIHQQMLSVRNPENPTSTKVPKGIKFAKVYRYVGTKYHQKV
jgi:hypothetical protein